MSSRAEAVEQIYLRAYRPLVGLLITIGNDQADAEEVAQDAFARLWDRWDRISTYDDPEAWVRMVAVRLLLGRLRRARVASRALGRLRPTAADTVEPPSPALVDIGHALQQLSPQHRAVVALYYVYDLPVDTVAAELGIPTGTVKSRLARARDTLAPLLDDSETAQEGSDSNEPHLDERPAAPRGIGGNAHA